MKRRDFLQATVAQTSALERVRAAQTSARPNFLFLIADDLTFRGIHAAGNDEVRTPNLDRLMQRGCTFTHCFHQGSWTPAVCVASRTMLNTGLSAFRCQQRTQDTPVWGQTMRESGYDTFIAGKWHLDKPTLQRSFSEIGPIGPGMFESTPEAYHRPAPGNTWTPWDTSLKGHWLHTKEWQKTQDDHIRHSCAIWADAAVERLAKTGNSAKPFFMYVGFNEPHDPRQAPKEFVDMYPPKQIEMPPNYLPQHPFDQGDFRVRDEVLAPFPRTREAVQVHRAEYYALISYLDEQIGRILSALQRSGKADNTYVILTADHGLAVGQHGLMGKQNLYDHSIRMPLIVNGPGIRAGRRVDSLVYQHSVFPTACELAGIRVPKTVEFPSLADLLRGGTAEKHDAVFSYYRGFQRAVRTREHKLIVYPEAGVTQLFDLDRDPWEITNVAGRPEYRTVQERLAARLRRFQVELGDPLGKEIF